MTTRINKKAKGFAISASNMTISSLKFMHLPNYSISILILLVND